MARETKHSMPKELNTKETAKRRSRGETLFGLLGMRARMDENTAGVLLSAVETAQREEQRKRIAARRIKVVA
jgi:hypothetical protein